MAEASEEEDQGGCTEANDNTEEGHLEVIVVGIVLIRLVGRVVGIKVAQETSVGEGISNRIHDEDTDNQKGKDLVRESSRKADVTGQIEKAGNKTVPKQPNTNPGIECEERNVHVLRHVIDDSREGEDRTRGTNDALSKKIRKRCETVL
jgi:hypothetical protein